MTPRSRFPVLALAALLTVALLPTIAGAQLASDGTIAADARAVSQRFFADGTAVRVVLARDDVPVDALASGYAQGVVEGPLVLTSPGALSAQAEAEIDRLGAQSVTILGGTEAVSQTVEDALIAKGLTVTRFGGDTRFGTANQLAAGLTEDPAATIGILARAFGADGNPTSVFADSLAAGTLSAFGGYPIYLTQTDILTGATRQALETSALEEILIVGGTDAISEDVAVDLESRGFAVTRLGGADRSVTAAQIARVTDDFGPGVERVVLVDGYVEGAWGSGYAAAAANLTGDTVVLLSNGEDLPDATTAFLAEGEYEVVCGPNTTATACAAAGGDTGGDAGDDPGPSSGEFFTHLATFDVTRNQTEVAEIVDVTTDGQTLIYTDSAIGQVGFVDISDPADPQPAGQVEVGGEPTSVAVAGDHTLVAVNTTPQIEVTRDGEAETVPDYDNPSGTLQVLDTNNAQAVRIDLGGQPDAIAISPDGTYAAVAIENERDEEENGGLIPQQPAGYLVVVDISADDPAEWTTTEVDLTGLAQTAPSDPEPEFVDINADNQAVVTLQENNHLAVVDLATGTVTADFSAGSVMVTDVDATEEEIGPQDNGDIQLTEEITRRREPDAVTWIDADSFVTANEGDYEDADGVEGGSRGFTVFDVDGTVTFDAGNSFEYAQIRAGHYNEGRSANKGGEPEGTEFATFGEDDLLFIGAERTNVVGVYDVTEDDPSFLQLLPTGSGPEGLKAIPDRDLFVVAAENSEEDAYPSLITIYGRTAPEPTYPQIASVGTPPVPWVALSGLAGGEEGPIFGVSDSILGVGYVYRIDTTGEDSPAKATITQRTAVSGASFNLDLEGIDTAPEGGWWMVSEGRYDDDGAEERPNAVIRVDPDGAVTDEVFLPDDLVAQATSSGLEGVAVTGTGQTEFVYVVVQREWADDAEGIVKIGRYDVAAETWGFVDYTLDEVASPNGGWVGLSEITRLPDGTFAIIERDNQAGTNARIKRIYGVDLANAAFVPYGQPRETVDKTLLADVLDELRGASIWTPDKLEGLAVNGDGHVVVVTDNDGLDDAIGQTVYLDLGPVETALSTRTN